MLIQRRPTPAQAKHLLRALTSRESQLRKYHRRRAQGLCVKCETPSNTAECPDCYAVTKLKRAA